MKTNKSSLLFYSLVLLIPSLNYSICVADDTVSVDGRTILLNKQPYHIRGICYNTIAKGQTYLDEVDYTNLSTDIALMQGACINTIRTYFPITDKTVLDAFADAGIKIIMGIPGSDPRVVKGPAIINGSYINYIKTYKNHPAILMWEFGNEYNYHPEWFSNNISNWYTYLNNAAAAVHLEDLAHPVSTAHGDLPDLKARTECPNVDVWGMNVYRWDNPETIFNEWEAVSTKPMYLSESGTDSYNNQTNEVDEESAATAIHNIWLDVNTAKSICSGITFFEFVDEWWKASGSASNQDKGGVAGGYPFDGFGNVEYFGIVDIDRNEKKGYKALKEAYCLAAGNLQGQDNIHSLTIYPNPTKQNVKVSFHHVTCDQGSVTLLDLHNKIVYTKDITTTTGANTIELYLDDVKPGLYIVKIELRDLVLFKKLEVVR